MKINKIHNGEANAEKGDVFLTRYIFSHSGVHSNKCYLSLTTNDDRVFMVEANSMRYSINDVGRRVIDTFYKWEYKTK